MRLTLLLERPKKSFPSSQMRDSSARQLERTSNIQESASNRERNGKATKLKEDTSVKEPPLQLQRSRKSPRRQRRLRHSRRLGMKCKIQSTGAHSCTQQPDPNLQKRPAAWTLSFYLKETGRPSRQAELFTCGSQRAHTQPATHHANNSSKRHRAHCCAVDVRNELSKPETPRQERQLERTYKNQCSQHPIAHAADRPTSSLSLCFRSSGTACTSQREAAIHDNWRL